MAESVKDGTDTAIAAAKFGVRISQIQGACREFGVSYRRTAAGPGSGRPTTIPVLADLLNPPRKTLQVIADKHGISRQAVQQVRSRAIQAGIRVPATAGSQATRAAAKEKSCK